MASDGEITKPRWAAGLSDEQWSTLHDLLMDGVPGTLIAAKVGLDPSKLRSLQVYARKHGPRRRLTRFAEFKDALLGDVENFGGDFSRAMTTIAAMALDPDVKDTTQLRAIEAMTKYVAMMDGMLQGDRTAEKERKQEERGDDGKLDPNEIVACVLKHYGVHGK